METAFKVVLGLVNQESIVKERILDPKYIHD